jgi:formylglycine-generating enzyme required for sulfatase activity
MLFVLRDHIFPATPSSSVTIEKVEPAVVPLVPPLEVEGLVEGLPNTPPKLTPVEIHTTPSGAVVFLDGKEVGVTPFSIDHLLPGSHALSLRRSCFRPVKQNFVLTDKPLYLEIQMDLVCGDLQVVSTPPGARVWINGRKRGVTPYSMIGVRSGELDIEVRTGRAVQKRTVRIQPGQTSKEPFAFLRPKHPDQRTIWQDSVTGMEFVWVNGGCFAMGNPDSDKLLKEIAERKKHRVSSFFKSVFEAVTDSGEEEDVREFDIDEGPVHEVCLDGLWVGRTEVTNSQYMLFAEATGTKPEWLRDDNEYNVETGGNAYYKTLGGASLSAGLNPVVGVSWQDVTSFGQWFTAQTGFKSGLPTEAEWEYVCRSGGQDEEFAGGSEVDAVAWYADTSDQGSHEVATLQANGLGLFDLSGNVWEWTLDSYHSEAYASHDHFNPVNQIGGEKKRRVVRGGSWRSKQQSLRCTARFGLPIDDTNVFLGFRMVMTGDEKK